MHNNGLDFVAQNLLSFDRVPSEPEVIINLSATFVNNSSSFPRATFDNLVTAGTLAYNNVLSDSYPSDFTERQIAYAKQVEAVFDGYENPFNHIDEINTKINSEVQKVINSDLTEEEQMPLLAGLAVGKSSLHYWNQQVVDSNSYWSQVNYQQASKIDWPDINWRKVGRADVKGAVGGFFKGLFGGGGTALGGAATGALGSSAAELAVQIYDYYFGE